MILGRCHILGYLDPYGEARIVVPFLGILYNENIAIQKGEVIPRRKYIRGSG